MIAEGHDGAFILGPGEGRPIDLGGFAMSVKADGEQTGGAFSLLEADEPTGFGPPLHIHHDAAEAFYVLEGEYIIFLAGREHSCPAGSFIFIPAGTPHGFRVGGIRSRKLNFYAPAAMVGYFNDLSDATKKGDLQPGLLSEIALRHSMEVLGPVPDAYARGMGIVTAPSDPEAEADVIRAIERTRLRSLVEADMDVALSVHADDFQLITPSGGSISKEQYLGATASGEIDYRVWEPGPIDVRVHGSAAVIRYQAQLEIVFGGQQAPLRRYWHIDLYEKRDGRWQVVWSQATQIQDGA